MNLLEFSLIKLDRIRCMAVFISRENRYRLYIFHLSYVIDWNGMLIDVNDNRLPINNDALIETKRVRFRTLDVTLYWCNRIEC